jgi:hypothetical protein
MDTTCGKGSKNPLNVFKLLKYKIQFNSEHPNYFEPDGLLCFTGAQGTGKTLSAVNYTYGLLEKYPSCKLATNLMLNDYPIVSFEEFCKQDKYSSLMLSMHEAGMSDDNLKNIMYQTYLRDNRVFPFINNDDLQRYGNGEFGFIFLIDEIQLYMNSLESKNINMEVMTQISQQRKQRKHIICTSQVFGRMAKPLREQFSSVVVCKCYLKTLQINSLVDRDDLDSDSSTETTIKGTCKQRFFWFHNPTMYKRYDTYYVIEKGKFADNDNRKGDFYGFGLSDNN